MSTPRPLDVRALRLRLRMTQAVFSGRFGFSLPALRHWERGERRPSGAALALLKVIANNPRAVLAALKAPIPANLQRRRRGGVAATSVARLPREPLPPELADTPLQAAHFEVPHRRGLRSRLAGRWRLAVAARFAVSPAGSRPSP